MLPTDRLTALRDQVRAIDEQMYELAAKRLQVARQIGAVKKEAHLPIKDYRTEKEVLERSRVKAREHGLPLRMGEELASLLIRYAVDVQDEFHRRSSYVHSAPAKKVLIAGGRGRMGLWLSEFFESFGHEVSHYDRAGGTEAGRYPLIEDLAAAACEADLVVLSVPITATAAFIDQLAASGTGALVFDICSLKTPLLGAIRQAQARGLKIGSVHPMFGPSIDLLAGSHIVLCDTGDADALAQIQGLFQTTTANLHTVPLARHDQLMSYVLGLSHLTNLVFAQVLAASGEDLSELQAVASTTFQQQMRLSVPVAQENQELYFEIQAENSFTPHLLAAFERTFQRYAAAITSHDQAGFCRLMAASRRYLGV